MRNSELFDMLVAEANHPFADNQFDLVINRHEYYDPTEVMRVLKPLFFKF